MPFYISFKRALLGSVVTGALALSPIEQSLASGFDICDLNISVNETEELGGLYTNIIKNCILLGIDPPPAWIPKGGRGYGVFKTHSGLQTITGKAPSLCPRLSTKDSNCGTGLFPNCMGAPGDGGNGGAASCSDDGDPQQTPGNEGDIPLEDPSDITDSNMMCAINFEEAATLTDQFSVCVSSGSSFCGFDLEGDSCFGGEDGRSPGPFPSQYVTDEWNQVNGVQEMFLGGAFGGMTGTFKLPEGGYLEIPYYNCHGEDGCWWEYFRRRINAGTVVEVTNAGMTVGGETYRFTDQVLNEAPLYKLSLGGKPLLIKNETGDEGNSAADSMNSSLNKAEECRATYQNQAQIQACIAGQPIPDASEPTADNSESASDKLANCEAQYTDASQIQACVNGQPIPATTPTNTPQTLGTKTITSLNDTSGDCSDQTSRNSIQSWCRGLGGSSVTLTGSSVSGTSTICLVSCGSQ